MKIANGTSDLFLGANYDFAFFPLSDAFREHLRMISERHVNDATLVRWHRLKRKRRTPRLYAIGHFNSKTLQGFCPTLSVAFDVNHDRHPFIYASSNHEPYYVLESSERLSSATDQDTEIVPLYIKGHSRSGLTVFPSIRDRLRLDSPRKTQQTQKLLQNFAGFLFGPVFLHLVWGRNLGRRADRGYPDDRVLSSKPKDPAPTFLYDDYFHLVSG